MNRNRKMKGFYVTLLSVNILILAGFVTGVPYQGSDIISLAALQSAIAGAFFGANFGEHWAQSKAAKNAEESARGDGERNNGQ